MKLLIIKFSPVSSQSLNTPLSTLFSNTLNLSSPLSMRDQVSHPYKLYFRERHGCLRSGCTSCLTKLYISNSCSMPWYDCDRRVSCTPNSGYSILLCRLLPQLVACAVRSMELKNSPPTPPVPCCRVLASPSTYIRVKQWGGMPHSTVVPRWDQFVNQQRLGSASSSAALSCANGVLAVRRMGPCRWVEMWKWMVSGRRQQR